MKKNMIALAVAACVAAPAFAAEFQPAPGTRFEVNVEVGAYYQSRKNSAGASEKGLIGASLNQIEIKAEHKINDDISLFGEIEVDYDGIIDNDTVKTDDTRLGIKSKSFGTFSVGQFDSYFEDNVMETLGLTHGDKASVTEPGANNDGRHLQYLKTFGDVTFALDFMNSQDKADKSVNSNGNAVTLAYKLGDLTLAGGFSKIAKFKSDTGDTVVTAGAAKSVAGLSAKYKLGAATLLARHANEKREGGGNNKFTGMGLTYLMGQFDFGVAFQKVKEGTAASRNEYSVGVGYTPFKNMTLFADVAKYKKAKGKDDVVEIGVKYAF